MSEFLEQELEQEQKRLEQIKVNQEIEQVFKDNSINDIDQVINQVRSNKENKSSKDKNNNSKEINHNHKQKSTSKDKISYFIPRTRLGPYDKDYNEQLCIHCQIFVKLGVVIPWCQLCFFIHSYLYGVVKPNLSTQAKLIESMRLDRYILLDQYGLMTKYPNDYLTELLESRFNKSKRQGQEQTDKDKAALLPNQLSVKASNYAANQWHKERDIKYNADFKPGSSY